jgi:tRNA dimethylallyltransferase
LIVILGPTASGKTQLATRLASRIRGEIISADSRQVYRSMDIGTGKDLAEYTVEGQSIPYHLIDILDAGEKYNVLRFQEDVNSAVVQIKNRDRTPILCGGTGMYIQAVLNNHQYTSIPSDEIVRAELASLSHEDLLSILAKYPSQYSGLADTSTKKRTVRAIEIGRYLNTNPTFQLPAQTPFSFTIFGLNPPVEVRRSRISRRLEERLQNGLVHEVQGLLAIGITAEQLIYYGLEYKYITKYLLGTYSYEEMVKKLETEIHRFAKRQMTYFRKMERDGLAIQWLNASESTDQCIETILSHVNQTDFTNE